MLKSAPGIAPYSSGSSSPMVMTWVVPTCSEPDAAIAAYVFPAFSAPAMRRMGQDGWPVGFRVTSLGVSMR